MKAETRTYVCKRVRLCRYLIEHGFKPYKIAPDRNNSKYNVWLFEQTDELMAAIMDYVAKPKTMKI